MWTANLLHLSVECFFPTTAFPPPPLLHPPSQPYRFAYSKHVPLQCSRTHGTSMQHTVPVQHKHSVCVCLYVHVCVCIHLSSMTIWRCVGRRREANPARTVDTAQMLGHTLTLTNTQRNRATRSHLHVYNTHTHKHTHGHTQSHIVTHCTECGVVRVVMRQEWEDGWCASHCLMLGGVTLLAGEMTEH